MLPVLRRLSEGGTCRSASLYREGFNQIIQRENHNEQGSIHSFLGRYPISIGSQVERGILCAVSSFLVTDEVYIDLERFRF